MRILSVRNRALRSLGVKSLALVACLVSAHNASAFKMKYSNDGFYVGSSYTAVDASFANITEVGGVGINGKGSFETIEFVGGFKYHPLVSGDFRLGFGMDSALIDNTNTELNLDGYGSFYWRPESANPKAKTYGLLGLMVIGFSNEAPGGNSDTKIAPSWGGGIGFTYREDINFNIEIRYAQDSDDNTYNTFGLSVDYRL